MSLWRSVAFLLTISACLGKKKWSESRSVWAGSWENKWCQSGWGETWLKRGQFVKRIQKVQFPLILAILSALSWKLKKNLSLTYLEADPPVQSQLTIVLMSFLLFYQLHIFFKYFYTNQLKALTHNARIYEPCIYIYISLASEYRAAIIVCYCQGCNYLCKNKTK